VRVLAYRLLIVAICLIAVVAAALAAWNVQKTLNSNELLLMSDTNATSFDSRYFGVIDRPNVQAVVKSIFIEKGFRSEKPTVH